MKGEYVESGTFIENNCEYGMIMSKDFYENVYSKMSYEEARRYVIKHGDILNDCVKEP